MATASSSFCAVRFFSPATRPSQPTYFSQAVRIAPRTFSSSQSLTHTSISSAKSIFAGSPLSFTLTLPSTRGPSRVPITIVAAKGYKMKTHKASAKRFRVTGGGKIVRRKAGKQHLLAKKNTKRKLRLSKMGMYCLEKDEKLIEEGTLDEEGLDSNGRTFKNAKEMWNEEIGYDAEGEQPESSSTSRRKQSEWYIKGIRYWQGIEASVNGVLGGYGHLNDVDIRGSEEFLKLLLLERFGEERKHLVALDCGAGIGRVTKNLLLRFFNEVDLVEPVLQFMNTARGSLFSRNNVVDDPHPAVNFYCIPLQEFNLQPRRYDVIWVQWCIGHLPDDDFVTFFGRAKDALKDNGFIVLKDNIAGKGFWLDMEDKSITRSHAYFMKLFHQCGLHVYKMKDEKGLPEELFAVKMYALVVNKDKHE